MGTPVIGMGAGGHAQVILKILQMDSLYDPVGLLDFDKALKGKHVLDVEVVGGD